MPCQRPPLALAPLLLLLLWSGGARAQCLSADDDGGGGGGEAEALLRAAQTDFALALLREAAGPAGAGPLASAVLSPRSAFDALALALAGARNATARGLREALRLPAQLPAAAALKAALRHEGEGGGATDGKAGEVRTASRVWVSTEERLRPCVSALLGASAEPLAIAADPAAAVARVNAWAAERTGGRVRDLVPALRPDARLVLTSAAAFRGAWASRFDPAQTAPAAFHAAPSRAALVPMMRQRGHFALVASERLRCHALELPFQGGDVRLLVLLPPFAAMRSADGAPEDDGATPLDGLLRRLDAAALSELLRDADGAAQTVDVHLPRLHLDSDIDLVPILERMGVGDAFQASADYSGFTGARGPSFDGARQRATLEADEEGATAAAATALFLFRSARPAEPPRFIANHPFAFLLLRRLPADAPGAPAVDVLFAGVYRGPPPPSNN